MDIQKKRVEKWDILKFILIFLVVLGHYADKYTGFSPMCRGLYIYIYTFHMPLFLFISGLFSKNNIAKKRYKNIFSFFTLYLLIKIFNMISKMIVYREFSFNLFSEGGAPWYALAVFIYSFVTILIKNVSHKYVMIFSIILAVISGYDNTISTSFSLARIITYYPFFYLGYCLDPQKVSEFFSKKYYKIISVIVLLIPAIIVVFKLDSVYWLRPLLTNSVSYASLRDARPFGGLDRLAYYAVAFLMSSAVICLTPDKLGNGTVARLGSRSLQVYALHYIVIYLLYGLLNSNSYICKHSWVIFPLSVATTLLFSLKIFEPFFNTILKPKGLKQND